MKDCTAQDLLAERRDNVNEMRRETDKTARAMLQMHVDSIDDELERRRAAIALSQASPAPGPLFDLAADLARSRTRRNEIDMSGIAVDYARRYQALREKYAKLSRILHEAHEPMWLVAVPEAATWHECKRDSCKLAQAMLAEVEGLA